MNEHSTEEATLMTTNLHQALHEAQEKIDCGAEDITNALDGEFFLDPAACATVRKAAVAILAALDDYERLNTSVAG